MSEMIKYKDRSITLGTCQNLYYATYADLKNNVEYFTKLSGLSVEGYLNEKYGFRYRFPFADEKPNIGNYTPYDRGVMVKIPRDLLKNKTMQIAHNRVFTRNDEVPGFSYGLFNHCPTVECDEVEIMDWSNLRNYLIFEITQQMQFNGQLVTVGNKRDNPRPGERVRRINTRELRPRNGGLSNQTLNNQHRGDPAPVLLQN